MRSGSKWPMIGLRPCPYSCAYVDPVFTSQSYDISISTSTRRTNLSLFLVLMLNTLMSTQFPLAYICAYAYVLMKTRLNFLDTDRDCKLKKEKLNTIFSKKKVHVQTHFLSLSHYFYFTFINKTLDIIWSVFQKLIKTLNFL